MRHCEILCQNVTQNCDPPTFNHLTYLFLIVGVRHGVLFLENKIISVFYKKYIDTSSNQIKYHFTAKSESHSSSTHTNTA